MTCVREVNTASTPSYSLHPRQEFKTKAKAQDGLEQWRRANTPWIIIIQGVLAVLEAHSRGIVFLAHTDQDVVLEAHTFTPFPDPQTYQLCNASLFPQERSGGGGRGRRFYFIISLTPTAIKGISFFG